MVKLKRGDPVVAYHENGAAMLGHVSDINPRETGFGILFKGPGNVTFMFSSEGKEFGQNLGWHLAIPASLLLKE